MRFSYTAIKDSKTIRGFSDATSREALINSLVKQGLRPVVIKAANSLDGQSSLSIFLKGGTKKVSLKELVLFTRQLSVMISAGVPLSRAFTILGSQAQNKYFQDVIANLTKDIESGTTLADAFGKYPSIFSEVYINMVRAGETGGVLEEILKRLAAQVEQDASIRKKIRGAMAYPIVILTITIIAFFGIMIFIMPKISKLILSLGGPHAKLPIYTVVLLHISNFFVDATIIPHVSNAIIIIAIGIIAGVILVRYIRTPKGKYNFHAFLLRMPVFKVVITKIAIARFARTFASLMSAGVSVLDALEVTGGAIGNKVIQAELKNAADEVRNGKQLSEPINNNKYFPPIVGQMLAVGEETGQIDTILIKVADFYEEEVSVVIDSLSSLIEPIMIIILGSVVGLIAASVMGPIASLNQDIGNNGHQ